MVESLLAISGHFLNMKYGRGANPSDSNIDAIFRVSNEEVLSSISLMMDRMLEALRLGFQFLLSTASGYVLANHLSAYTRPLCHLGTNVFLLAQHGPDFQREGLPFHIWLILG